MAAITAAPDLGLCDDDIVRYWTILALDDDAAAFLIVGTKGVSFSLARSCVAIFDGDPIKGQSARRRMLRNVEVDRATYRSAVCGSASGDASPEELAALLNPYHAAATQDRWGGLTEPVRVDVLRCNEGLDPSFIDARSAELGDPDIVAENPATPTATLARIWGNLPGAAVRSSVLCHRNARREWVLDALQRHGALSSAAAMWPGFTDAELAELAQGRDPDGEPTTVAGTAQYALDQRRGSFPLTVESLRTAPLVEAVALRFRHLTDDAVTAAKLISRNGFAGTVDELIEVAATFT